MNRCTFVAFLFWVMATSLQAQVLPDTADIVPVLRKHIAVLTGKEMAGRGYVSGSGQGEPGVRIAAQYISNAFREAGLQVQTQPYSFPVNTFPGGVSLALNGRVLRPGVDYIIDAAAASCSDKEDVVKKVDLSLMSKFDLELAFKAKSGRNFWLMEQSDSFCSREGIRSRDLAAMLPTGRYIFPVHGKMTWTVAQNPVAATVFYVEDTAMPAGVTHAKAQVDTRFEDDFRCENIVATVPGKLADSVIVFSAHYDHLGMMGSDAMFPGGSDNASGTAMLLYLAAYFAAHPQRYTMVFIAFSGEEAGLLGSHHFSQHPLVPFQHIRFVVNLDIMGDASGGVTVVNATKHPYHFSMLRKLNNDLAAVSVVKSRGPSANSDHYYFDQAGVPAFFVYSNGGLGYYHDVFDKGSAMTLHNIPDFARLMIRFAAALQGK